MVKNGGVVPDFTETRSGHITSDLKKEASEIRKELESLAAHEETFWKQCGKALWLKEGDRDTSFFHKKTSHRFHTNLITKLRNTDGNWIYEEKDIQQCIIAHFLEVFSSSRPNSVNIAQGTAPLKWVVESDMVDDLIQLYTEEEVMKALFQMAPLKSPGPDGMPPIFFQRHISLCNVIYKIASKAVANRLKSILDRIISPTQSAFVPGRLITDNILIAFEANHFLNTKTSGRQGFMALKLDVSKAYNKGVNNLALLFLKRGFVQDNPLFPYLFLFCTEAFSSLIQNAETDNRLKGISIFRGAPCISHLLFTDDTLIFAHASLESARKIKEILEVYRLASG
ncbi:UNVERIFIED_CONTAM: hypothetical protein Sradi_2030000 [Sesamum radiatum]|uniref:Reverse transcriptase domain-containing protein n=1 Tax=Sesamum radiatum TaxID=300843 RepID=A0AAW2TGN2_SESRA